MRPVPRIRGTQHAVANHVESLQAVPNQKSLMEKFMQKKLIALAVAGLSTAAFAQSNVTVYGRANLGFDSYSATGSAAGAAQDYKGRTRVFDNGSRIGFRGEENLGNGLKASFVIESGVNIDSGTNTGQGGQASTSVGTLGTRSSWLALGGNWGEVRLGRQDLYWGDGVLNQTSANYINTATTLSSGVGSGIVGGPTNRTSNAGVCLPELQRFPGYYRHRYDSGRDWCEHQYQWSGLVDSSDLRQWSVQRVV